MRRRTIRLLTDHFLWKLLSVFIAFLLWIALVDEPELTTTVAAPIEFKNVSDRLEFASELPDRILLQIRGPRTRISDAIGGRTAVVLDLADLNQAGERTYTITPGVAELPARVGLVRSVPSQIRLRMENRLRRSVPVRLRFLGAPPEGYRVSGATFVPESVTIVGPESRLGAVTEVETDPLDLSTRSAGFESRVSLFVADPRVRIEGAPSVRVKVSLEKVRQ
jgi:YbbR domain-containing protein